MHINQAHRNLNKTNLTRNHLMPSDRYATAAECIQVGVWPVLDFTRMAGEDDIHTTMLELSNVNLGGRAQLCPLSPHRNIMQSLLISSLQELPYLNLTNAVALLHAHNMCFDCETESLNANSYARTL